MKTDADPSELADITQSLTLRALESGSVCRTSLSEGLTVFAYPGEKELLVGLGYSRDRLDAYTIDKALSRRFESPKRFACWLPALFANGSFFMLQRRHRGSNGEARSLSSDEIGDVLTLFGS